MPNGRTLEQAEKQIAALIEENKRLAAELESLQAGGAALDKATRDALAAKTAAETACGHLSSLNSKPPRAR